MTDTDIRYMQQALALASRGRGYTAPNPMVGAVVVNGGQVVGQGWHQEIGGPHAEVNAINDAGDSAEGATIYVTLEPCSHTGKTPPCTEKILNSGIRRVVSAMTDPNPKVSGLGHSFLTDHGIEVSSGVLEAEAMELNEAFIKHITTGCPFVVLKWAATLDGQIATSTGNSKWITGEIARAYVHELRHNLSGIMVGSGTILKDNPSLTTRRADSKGSDPVRIILDTMLKTPVDAQVLSQTSDSDTMIICSNDAPETNRAALEKAGAVILPCPTNSGGIDLKALMPMLGARGINSILIEGGSHVIASAVSSGIADKACMFYAPKILGGTGTSICSGKGPDMMAEATPVHRMQVTPMGDDIMVEGYFS